MKKEKLLSDSIESKKIIIAFFLFACAIILLRYFLVLGVLCFIAATILLYIDCLLTKLNK